MMYYDKPELIQALIDANEHFLSLETDSERKKQLEMDIQADKHELERSVKFHEKLKEVQRKQKARVGHVTQLGEFVVEANKLRISDPCYDKKTWCAGTLDNPVKGKWLGFIQYQDEGSWGIRNSTLIAVHETSPLLQSIKNGYLYDNHLVNLANIDVGVDSGQAGIFDEEQYQKDGRGEYGDGNTFYGRACAATLGDHSTEPKDHLQAGAITEGVVSSSGDGDGSYRCFFNKNDAGQVDAVEISFYWHKHEIEEEEEFEEEEETEEVEEVVS